MDPKEYRRNLDQWTVYFMVGLGIVEKPVFAPTLELTLTSCGEMLYKCLSAFRGVFGEGTSSSEILKIKRRIIRRDEKLYDELRDVLLKSKSIKNILLYLRHKGIVRMERRTFYEKFGAEFGIKEAGFNRLPSSLQLLEFCGLLRLDYETITVVEEAVDIAKIRLQIVRKVARKVRIFDDALSRDFLDDISPYAYAPQIRERVVSTFVRNRAVANKLKLLYCGKCQVCTSTFRTKKGENYAEIHHMKSLGDEGSDSPDNMLVLCPTCHMKFHYARWKEVGRDSRSIHINMNQRRILIQFVPEHLQIFEPAISEKL